MGKFSSFIFKDSRDIWLQERCDIRGVSRDIIYRDDSDEFDDCYLEMACRLVYGFEDKILYCVRVTFGKRNDSRDLYIDTKIKIKIFWYFWKKYYNKIYNYIHWRILYLEDKSLFFFLHWNQNISLRDQR